MDSRRGDAVTVDEVACEYNTQPTAILVHDPVSAGAFARIESVQEDDRLESEVLFRSRPDAARYARQHESLVRVSWPAQPSCWRPTISTRSAVSSTTP